MVVKETLKDKGFGAYVTLRDPTSGKEDGFLCGLDGYPKYMFMSINCHQFQNASEGAEAVNKQCKILHSVSMV